jgi:polyisoprenoid-binding protein YceI
MKYASLKLRSLLLAGVLLATAAVAAELTQFKPEKSQITFVSKQMGVPVDGRFKKFDAKIAVDPAKPETGKAQFDIDLASIDTGSSEADAEVKGKSWFNSAAFPKASFVSSQVRALGGGRYEALGKLTIKGTTRDVAAPFVIKTDAGGAWFDGGFTLNRLQFKIGEGAWADTSTVADEIQVKFKIFVTGEGANNTAKK